MAFILMTTVLSLIYIVQSRPNFVILLADDLGYGDVGCFGNHSIKTPNIDKLAARGIKLNHHLTTAAVCTPSRAGLLTGRYPIRAGMESSSRNKVFFFIASSGGLPDNETTFARALKERGYSTAIIGKWHLGNDCNFKGDGCHHPLNHGFDYFYGLPLSNFKDLGDDGESVITSYSPNIYSYIISVIVVGITLGYVTYFKNRTTSVIFIIILVIIPSILILFLVNLKTINGVLMQNMTVIEQPVRLKGLTQRFVDKAKHFLGQKSERKESFLLYMSFVHVHTALFCSTEFEGKSKHGRYGDNIEEMDWAIGELIKTLENLEIFNSTFIYFSSDNGGHIEEVGKDGHREGGFNGIFRGGKMMGGMEGGIRVPSIVTWPNELPTGEVSITTSQMDLFPTIMEIANIPLPKDRTIDGKSLVGILKKHSQKHHKFLFHYCGKQIHAATYIPDNGDSLWKIHWTTPKFKPGTSRCEYVCHCFGAFVEHHDPPLLYDLSKDPSESFPIKINSDPNYIKIISKINEAKSKHEASIETIPDQFSFFNTIWKPWLQPCCNFPLCKCTEPNSTHSV